MNSIINAKDPRASRPKVVAKVRRGARFTVLYRAKPLGHSTVGRTAADHDATLYPP